MREHAIRICDDCLNLSGEMCHEPACVFCRRTMAEVGEYLDVLLIRPVVDGVRLAAPPANEPDGWQGMVREFHAACGVLIGDSPAVRRPELRANLIEEEAKETAAALRAGDLVQTIDGLCDVIYVALGCAVECGVDLAPFFAEVHRSNMQKAGGPRRADGKILKPAGWTPPNIAGLLATTPAPGAGERK